LQDLLAPGVVPLQLANPMSTEQSVMRTSLFPGLVEALQANMARQQDRVQLFEVGQCFLAGDGARCPRLGAPRVRQPLMIGGVIWGSRYLESWNREPEQFDFFDLKGDVQRLLAWAGFTQVTFERLQDPVLHPGQAAQVLVANEVVGRLGRLHPEIERRLDVNGAVFVMEFEAEKVLTRVRRRHGMVSKFPSVRRDLAIVVAETVAAGEIIRILEESLHEVLIDLRLFDVYQGKGIDSTEKSLGVGLTLQKPSATLTEEEIGRYMQRAVDTLAAEAGARLR
jgi:phenylalanyl-tRNA synthetase beta chain